MLRRPCQPGAACAAQRASWPAPQPAPRPQEHRPAASAESWLRVLLAGWPRWLARPAQLPRCRRCQLPPDALLVRMWLAAAPEAQLGWVAVARPRVQLAGGQPLAEEWEQQAAGCHFLAAHLPPPPPLRLLPGVWQLWLLQTHPRKPVAARPQPPHWLPRLLLQAWQSEPASAPAAALAAGTLPAALGWPSGLLLRECLGRGQVSGGGQGRQGCTEKLTAW